MGQMAQELERNRPVEVDWFGERSDGVRGNGSGRDGKLTPFNLLATRQTAVARRGLHIKRTQSREIRQIP